jgi:hypothetical protein
VNHGSFLFFVISGGFCLSVTPSLTTTYHPHYYITESAQARLILQSHLQPSCHLAPLSNAAQEGLSEINQRDLLITGKFATTATMQLPTNWGRWQEHHQSAPEYGMMSHSGMMQYDSRATSSPTVQQPSVAPQYMVGNSYSMPSVSSMTAPHYQPHNPFGFQAYPPSTPSPLVAPFRQFSDGRPTLRVMPISNDKSPDHNYPRDSMHSNIEATTASPEVKHELHTPPQPTRAQDSSAALTPTSAKNEGNKFENNTFIDNLMRVVQSKLNNKPEDNSPEARYPSPPRGSRSASPEDPKPNEKHPKKYRCDVADCNQKFAQKTHLYIHIRSHTGEKPYPCNHPGCGHYFSQLGNLKVCVHSISLSIGN